MRKLELKKVFMLIRLRSDKDLRSIISRQKLEHSYYGRFIFLKCISKNLIFENNTLWKILFLDSKIRKEKS